jgi:hypothetical protein
MLSEINAAVRSLETNLVIFCVLFVSFLVRFSDVDNLYTAAVSTIFKTLGPILTAVANFGKIQEVARNCWQTVRHQTYRTLHLYL